MKYLPIAAIEAAAGADLDAYRRITGREPEFPLNLPVFLDTVFGLAVTEVDMQSMPFSSAGDEAILGGLYPDGQVFIDRDKVVIVDARIENSGRKRFTVAHEAGHYSLHVRGNGGAGIYNRTTKPFLCREIGSGKAPLEFQADRYASALLMPAEYFPGIVIRSREVSMRDCGRELKERFGVSRQAAEIRLKDLGYTVTDGKYAPEEIGHGEKAFASLIRKGLLNNVIV